MMSSLDDKSNNVPNLDSDRVVKGIYPWFWGGFFVSLLTSVLLGNDSQMTTLVKEFSIFYTLTLALIFFTIGRIKGVKLGDPIYKNDPPILSKIADKSVFVIFGHALGFFTLRLFLHF